MPIMQRIQKSFGKMYLLIFSFIFLACAVGETQVKRGLYFKNYNLGFELWIPKGFKKSDSKKPLEGVVAGFYGNKSGCFSITIEDTKADSLNQYIEELPQSSITQFPGCEIETIKNLKAGGKPSAILVLTKLDNNEDFKRTEMICAVLETSRGHIIDLTVYHKKGSGKAAMKIMRWMMSTYLLPGESGLDPFMEKREMDLSTGLSYRLPPEFEKKPCKDAENLMYEFIQSSTKDRILVKRSGKPTLFKAMDAEALNEKVEARTRFSHPDGHDLLGTFCVPKEEKGDIGRALFGIRFKNGPRFCISVYGKISRRNELMRAGELMCKSLKYTDVSAAHKEVENAVEGLKLARKKRKTDQIEYNVKIIAGHIYLPSARKALCKVLVSLDEEAIQVTIIRALGNSGQQDVAPTFIRSLKNSKIKKKPVVIQALLEGLGKVQSSKALKLIFKFAQAGDKSTRSTAIRALGEHKKQKSQVTKMLLSLFKKLESSASKGSYSDRELLQDLKPALQDAFQSLLGKRVYASVDVEEILKK